MKPSNPYIIGLTGGIASGKTHLARALREAGAPVIDADAISRSLTAEGGQALPPIRNAFGDAVFTDSRLDRQKLATIVFSDVSQRKQLNDILHPMVFAEMERQLAEIHAPAVILEIPLLHETGYDKQCDEVWCAYVPQRVQINRLRERDSLSVRAARARLSSQLCGREKARRSTHVIRTDVPETESARQVVALWQQVMERVRDV